MDRLTYAAIRRTGMERHLLPLLSFCLIAECVTKAVRDQGSERVAPDRGRVSWRKHEPVQAAVSVKQTFIMV